MMKDWNCGEGFFLLSKVVDAGSHKRWAWDYMGPPTEGKDYKWYIYIYKWDFSCQLGDGLCY